MNRHYGFINQLSRKASEMVEEETLEKMFAQLDIAEPGAYQVLGGHEFLNTS